MRGAYEYSIFRSATRMSSDYARPDRAVYFLPTYLVSLFTVNTLKIIKVETQIFDICKFHGVAIINGIGIFVPSIVVLRG